MKTKTQMNLAQRSYGMFMALLCSFLLIPLRGLAQNVTISPRNGSMICALTAGSPQTQLGFQNGAFATWRHNQLSLMMTGSNYKTLTTDGQLSEHSNHFITGDKCTYNPADPNATYSNYIAADWGGDNLSEGYITISLPKGYRFTGYTFHVSHDVSRFGTLDRINPNTTVYMSETDQTFTPNKKTIALQSHSTEVKNLTRTGNDMGNILYFKTHADRNGFYAVLFRYIELTFTADADAAISLLPGQQHTTGVSMVEIPFNTGKVDLGEIKQGSYQGATRVSYQYNDVQDMPANMLLYEEESVQDDVAYDGTNGKMAYQRPGSITTVSDYFKLAPTGTEGQQIYYLETPVSATNQNGTQNPVEVRLVGATLNYTTQASSTFYITHTDGGRKYYMGTNGRFTTTPVVWDMDAQGHVYSGNRYLSSETDYVSTTQSVSGATTFVKEGNSLKTTAGRYIKYYRYGSTRYGVYTANNTYNWANVYTALLEDNNAGGGTVASGATIYLYDKEGMNPQEIVVNGTGSLELTDINNDAIKIGVKKGDVALVNFTVKLQSLNPYIDQMTVVLNDTHNGKNLRMTQTFTADDFSVGGGKFNFYLPTDCIGDPVDITFEDLYSKYGDETYDGGSSNSRYNFVESQHYNAFTSDNIYNGRDEAASSVLESARIAADANIRTQVGTVGDRAFRFNNADKLATQTGYLEEYQFTRDKYANQTDPGPGSFIHASFNSSEVNASGTEKTFYVFTTDETRYNIAPTTATQHRLYAFYEMIVNVQCSSYDPIITFKPVYDNTCYADETGADRTDAFYGVEVTAPSHISNGLASDVAVYKAISEAIDAGGSNVPADMGKIIYLDMSKLNGVYHSSPIGTYDVANFKALKDKFSKNALVFLPINSSARYDNFAYAKKGEVAGSFQAANNIILTDKTPFYSPYNIQVDAANYATYTREITIPQNGKVTSATVILPFTLDLQAGTHTNRDGLCSFTVNQMNASNCLSLDQEATASASDYAGNAYFSPVSGSTTEANVPYMVQVTNAPTDAKVSFIATQYGSDVVATKGAMASDYTFMGETATGTMAGSNYSFTNYGSYSGKKLNKNGNIFYFSGNMYLNSKNLREHLQYVYVYPFRGYYQYTGGSGAKVMKSFNVLYGENGATTGITDIDEKADLAVMPGNGTLTFETAIDQQVRVFAVNGTMVNKLSLKAGDRRTIALPAGVYIVNRTKMIVK